MRRLPVAKLIPGMKVGQPVYDENGRIWLGKGVILTRRYIDRLSELGIPSIYVDDGLLDDIELVHVISEETRHKAVETVKCLFKDTPKARALSLPPEVHERVNDIVNQVLGSRGALYSLIDIRAEAEYLFCHSVNVCVLAVMAGATLGWGPEQLRELALGALLHDIGMVRVPAEVLNKPRKLSKEEFEAIKKHTIYGEKMLEHYAVAGVVARSHHERLDGQGYPDGLTGSMIPPVAQLTGMADIYDALTADRLHRRAYQPHEAYEMLAGTGNFWFNHELVEAFLYNIAAFPVGSVVRLSDQAVAVVTENRPGFSLYPRVRVLIEPDGKKPLSPREFWCHAEGVGVLQILDHDEVAVLGLAPA
ncbi:HD-GYP domain-containing protein [Thermodesulfitimonas autotrophica]|uniref:HD-GYP domain-containing protein n=1 Tax=Thermodesulfitimonas autotrophica TaxID=1894989 RepID=UPI002FE2D3D2